MSSRQRNRMTAGFTLVELLAVLTIIALLAGMMASAVMKSYAIAAEAKTKAIITKLDAKMMFIWDQYRYRRMPITPTAATGVTRRRDAMQVRLQAMYETQRLELPKRWRDIYEVNGTGGYVGDDSVLPQAPAMHMSYFFKTRAESRLDNEDEIANDRFQSAECLYLIMTLGLGSDGLDQSSLTQASTADIDRDGWPEFIDGFGTPLQFFRWAPGFVSDLQPLGPDGLRMRAVDGNVVPWNPCPLNPLNLRLDALPFDYAVDTSNLENNNYNFALTPLILSAGPDEEFGITDYSEADLNTMTYYQFTSPYSAVRPGAIDPTNPAAFDDNIHNHQMGIR